MSTAVLRSQDALKSRFHANAFGYRPPVNPRRRQPPAPATSPPPHKSKRAGTAPPSRSPPPKPDRPAPARTGRKPRPAAAAAAGKEDEGGSAAADLRHHRRRPVMEEVTILKRGEAMKPSPPVLPGSNRREDPSISPVDPVYAGPGFSNPSISPVHPVYAGPGFSNPSISPVHPVYAGPGYSTFSPPPSSVPYPAFLRPLAASEEATRSLLRLLRLN